MSIYIYVCLLICIVIIHDYAIILFGCYMVVIWLLHDDLLNPSNICNSPDRRVATKQSLDEISWDILGVLNMEQFPIATNYPHCFLHISTIFILGYTSCMDRPTNPHTFSMKVVGKQNSCDDSRTKLLCSEGRAEADTRDSKLLVISAGSQMDDTLYPLVI